LGEENTDILSKLASPEEDNTHPRVINSDSHPRVLMDEQSENIKSIDAQKDVTPSPKGPSSTTNPKLSVSPDKLTSSPTSTSIPKDIEPSYMT